MTTFKSSSKKNVLFVDDEESIVIALKSLFKRDMSIKVFATTSQVEALDIVKKNQIHVVVSDMRMPGMNGAELLSHIRDISPNTLRILLTGYSEIDNIIESINIGQVYRFLEKPWDNKDIKEKITTAINISCSLWEDDLSINKVKKLDHATLLSHSILFIGDKRSVIFKLLHSHFRGVKIYHSTNEQKALVMISKHENITTVIAHIKRKNNIFFLLRVLKEQFPILVSMIITSEGDSKSAIKLINEAQVFRYIIEPMSEDQLRIDITQTLQYATLLQESPALIKQHMVKELSQDEKNRSLDILNSSFMNNFSDQVTKVLTTKIF